MIRRIRSKSPMTYREKLEARIASTGSHLCVGLDVRADAATEEVKRWIIRVIEETAPYAAAFKPNSAYFEALGWQGMRMLSQVLKAIPHEIPVILDVKRGDIGETQAYYAKACFDDLGVDAVTLNPYMGRDTLEPFLKYADKGLYLLGVTSNPGAKDIELQKVGDRHVYEIVGDMCKGSDQTGLVVGLTNASGDVLSRIPDVPLLNPGLGAQGGDLSALKDTARKAPILVNVSRGILYAENNVPFASAAKNWSEKIGESLGNRIFNPPHHEYSAQSRDASAA
ncbi:MAG: Orotidine-5-phosphate decarboxylase [Verrucomicrobiaceae bacterium]|nr:Orotidine-5-phosphate decarboxylase [Verrucomicrobiaceae bacterium]